MKSSPKSKEMHLQELFLAELADMYDAEHRIAKALPKMAKAAASEGLKEAVLQHLEETKGQIEKLEQVFELFDEEAKGKTCKATVGLLEEADEIAAEFKGSSANDSALISAMQKVEHYEMASYKGLLSWAKLLENDDAAELIEEILAEETTASETLEELADTECDETALGDPDSEEEEEEVKAPKAAKKSTTSKKG